MNEVNLEESFALLSTMSPKLLTSKIIKKKVPKILSLKKPLRRSSILYNTKCDKNKSLVLVEESSSETVSTMSSTSVVEKSDINNSIIVISDSENSTITVEDSFSALEINTQKCSLSDTKYEKVAEWISKVNSELKDTDYSNSTSKIESSLGNSLNQLAENSADKYKEINVREHCFSEAPDENVKENNDKNNSLPFSLRISINETDNATNVIPKKGTFQKHTGGISDSEGSEKCVEDILDDIYGDCWRENKDVILQQTERKQKKDHIPDFKKTLTDIKGKTKAPLFKDRNMPWINSLKNVCDSDTSSSDEDDYKFSDIRTKLNFEERENISPLTVKSSITNLNSNKKYNDDYYSEDDIFGDIGQDILSLNQRLLRKLENNDISNKLNRKNCTPLKEKEIGNSLLKSNKKDINKKLIQRNNVKTEDKRKITNRREKVDKFIDSASNDSSSNENNDVKECNKNKKPETKKYIEESIKQASFLSSLSGSLPIQYCDPSALIFRNNFKTFKDELAKKLFSMYNEKVYDGQIPSDTLIQWNDRMRGSAGFCYCVKTTSSQGRITRKVRLAFATKILDSAERLRDTMIHEMCHAASWVIDGLSDGHGPVWKKWAQKAMSVFPELPPIRRCHNYKINTKYTYRCTVCGYSIGRHSKSLDIERKRCGYCYGVFEILINKTKKSGEVQSVPVTPRKEPNAFALFVKHNYAAYKTSQLKHGDVMKLLGQKFSEMKLKSTN